MYLREGKTITNISEILGYSYQIILREINNRSILVYNSKVIKHIKIKEVCINLSIKINSL